MANILIKQGKEIAGSSLVTPSSKADKTDLSNIIQTGTTSTQAISAGTYFYLNDVLVKAKVAIANGATFTLNTNYEVVTAGALNELNNAIKTINTSLSTGLVKRASITVTTTVDSYAVVNKSTYKHIISVCPISLAALAFVYQANAGQWVIIFKAASNLTNIPNTMIDIDIFYTD